MIIAAIEAGGTKFVCGLLEADCGSSGKPYLLERTSIPTTSPAETLGAARDFLREASGGDRLPDCVGIGCFGPVELKSSSPNWGYITSTPKPGWRNTEVAGYFRREMGLPVAFDTDVNAAAYGEYLWGGARGLSDFIYLTVGTGIGGGVFSGGSVVHGLTHPELGHFKPAREAGDAYAGRCPYHSDCLEGLAAGPAVGERWNSRPEDLPPEHPAWELEAHYLAKAVAAYACILSPQRVLLGGGIGLRPGMAERVGELVGEELAGYVAPLAEPGALLGFVSRPELGADAGLFGAAALALRFSSV